jgi:hypothetical protein
MSKTGLRVFTYFRNLDTLLDKFVAFDFLVAQMTGKADCMAITSPHALGDTHAEITMNLDKLAEAEILLLVVPLASRRIKDHPPN